MSHESLVPGVDGASIYYRIIGSGEPTLLLCDGVGCAGYAWRYLIEHFRDRHRIVHWHYRGHGLSGAPADLDRLEIADHAEDARIVLDDAGVRAAVLFGHSMGVQVILEMYRRFPERVLGLVPICGSFGHVLDTVHDNQVLKRLFPILYALGTRPGLKPLTQSFWSRTVPTNLAYALAETLEINPKLVRPDDFRPYLEHLGAMDVEVFFRCLRGAARHTAADLLEHVRVATLIVAGERDGFTPVWLSEKMHREIPGSEFLLIPTGTHTAPIEMPDLLNLRVEKFLLDHFGAPVLAAAE